MAFEQWWNGSAGDDLRYLLRNPPTVEAKATYITLMARAAWEHGEHRQMYLDHAAEMERLSK